ncbi:MAG: hypothetical protein ACLPXB_10660 [Thiobacillaceae bacterium]
MRIWPHQVASSCISGLHVADLFFVAEADFFDKTVRLLISGRMSEICLSFDPFARAPAHLSVFTLERLAAPQNETAQNGKVVEF